MKSTASMVLTAICVLAHTVPGMAQNLRQSPRQPTPPPVFGLKLGSGANERTRFLRLEYQMRMLAYYRSSGVEVFRVHPGGPATDLVSSDGRRGQLAKGDLVTHVDGARIQSKMQYYRAMYLAGTRGGELTLRVRGARSGRTTEWKATAEPVAKPRAIRRNSSRATKVKALVIAATADKNIGPGASKNLMNLMDFLRGLPGFNEKTDLSLLAGKDVTLKNVLRAVAALRVEPTETLFCYVSSHGAHDKRLAGADPSGGHFFQLPGGDLMRTTFLGTLMDMDGQLTVLLTDTCNAPSTFRSRTPELTGTPPPTGIESKAFVDLLFHHVGVVDISGTSPGEFGWYTADGGWFSLGLFATLKDWAPDKSANWGEFTKTLTKNASKLYQSRKQMVLNNRDRVEASREDFERLIRQEDQRPKAFRMEVVRLKN